MALDYEATYPGQIDNDAAYPQGKARNVNVAGDGTGTPWEEQLVNDFFGLLQGAIKQGNVTPSGVPDTADASDYLTALRRLMARPAAFNFNAATFAAGPTQPFNDIDFGDFNATDKAWIVVGNQGVIQRSIDGWVWEAVTAAGGFASAFQGVAASRGGQGGVVMVGNNAEIQRATTIGSAPSQATADAGYASNFRGARHLGFSPGTNLNGLFFIVGDTGEIQYSRDTGNTWTRAHTGGGRLNDIAASGVFLQAGPAWSGDFVAVGDGGRILTTTDPDGAWTDRTADGGFADKFSRVIWTGERFVAVGDGFEIQTSDDGGVTWVQRYFEPAASRDLQTVLDFHGMLIAYGQSGGGAGTQPVGAKVMVSLDRGITWERAPGLGPLFTQNIDQLLSAAVDYDGGDPNNRHSRIAICGQGTDPFIGISHRAGFPF